MPIMDAAYMLRDGTVALVVAENAAATDGWIDTGECALPQGKLLVYRPTAAGAAAATITIQSSPDAGVTPGSTVTLAPAGGWPAGGAFTVAGQGAGTEEYPISWDQRYIRYTAAAVVVGFGAVQIGITPGKVFGT